MKKIILFLFSFIFLGTYSCSSGTQGSLQEILNSEWKTFSQNKQNLDGGFAMQIISPKGEYFISSGMGMFMSNTRHFRIASCTKTFTASAIMLLNQQGKLNIDDKITDNIPGTSTPYLPATNNYDIPYKNQITIRMLLMHRAGIFDLSNQILPDTVADPYKGINYLEYVMAQDPNHQFTFDELVGVNATYQLSNFVPDAQYRYSDTGYTILGKVIEQVTGQTYANFVTEQFFTPNKLNDTSMIIYSDEQNLPDPYVDGFVWDGTKSTNVTQSNMSPHVAEGNIVTTPKDLTNWIYKLLRSDAGLNSTTVATMMNGSATGGSSNAKYGLGISYTDLEGYGHSGAHPGYLTLMFYHPDTDVAYVLFANVWDASNGMTSILDQMNFMTTTANKVLTGLGY